MKCFLLFVLWINKLPGSDKTVPASERNTILRHELSAQKIKTQLQ